MAPSHKRTVSGYKVTDVYTELGAALLSADHERACGLAAELSCTEGGQARCVVLFLINTYCARCVNSGRAQMSLLRSCLAHIGDGGTQSPSDAACRDPLFRRGLCTLTLLVGCASSSNSHKEGSRDVSAVFAGVPRTPAPSLEATLEALRRATLSRDAREVSSLIRAVPDDAWCQPEHPSPSSGTPSGLGLGMPDVQRLRAAHRRDPVWELWRLGHELAELRGVSEYVDDCLHAFAWGFGATVRRARIHLLWYAYLVIVKGAPRAGPHPISTELCEHALSAIDAVFNEILSAGQRIDAHQVEAHAEPRPKAKSRASIKAELEAVAETEINARTRYLLMVPRPDPGRIWEVERDREEAAAGRVLIESEGRLEQSVKRVVVKQGHRGSGSLQTSSGYVPRSRAQPQSVAQPKASGLASRLWHS